jgi:diguanylate cyclase (GGDEF)-like protein
MSVPDTPLQPPSPKASEQEFAHESRQIEKHDWRVWGYSVFVILLLTFAVVVLALPAVRQGAETIFNIKLSEAIFGLIGLIIIFNVYAISQEVLIKRLRRQLAEKQGQSELLRTLAMVDPLTGLYNRRFAEHRLAAEVARSERKGHPLTVLTLDLNHFKQINDTYGHPAGDHVLQEFAAHLNKVVRGSDLAVRLGGDEFLVVLPECTLEQLRLVLLRLGTLEVTWQGQKIPVTFSAGWKEYEIGEEPQQLLARADEDLYSRKRARSKAPSASRAKQNPAKKVTQEETTSMNTHVMVDVTCTHCGKKNSVAIGRDAVADEAIPRQVRCGHCKQSWDPLLSGTVMAGPFPK